MRFWRVRGEQNIAAAADRRRGRETTGSSLRTQTPYKRTLSEEPAGPRLAASYGFDRCIKAPIRNNSATHAMDLWKISQGLRGERNFLRSTSGAPRDQSRHCGLVPSELEPPIWLRRCRGPTGRAGVGWFCERCMLHGNLGTDGEINNRRGGAL